MSAPIVLSPFDRALDDAQRFLIMAHAHVQNYKDVQPFDPEDASHEWLFAKRDLGIARLHLDRAAAALAEEQRQRPLRLRPVLPERKTQDAKPKTRGTAARRA